MLLKGTGADLKDKVRAQLLFLHQKLKMYASSMTFLKAIPKILIVQKIN